MIERKLLSTFFKHILHVAFVDEQVGKVVESIEKSKFKENTIVIFTSDHGWQMGEKEYLFKNSPWEESSRIPMIFKIPNQKGVVIEQPVSLIDIFPTLIDLCNLNGDYRKNSNGRTWRLLNEAPFVWKWKMERSKWSIDTCW